MKKFLCLLLSLTLAMPLLISCQQEEHEHTAEEKWTFDETGHWHKPTCEHTEQKLDMSAHEDEDANGICDVCTYVVCEHTYSHDFQADEAKHWREAVCGCVVDSVDVAEHVDADNDGACDVCEYNGGHNHTYSAEEWETTDTHHWRPITCGHDIDVSEKKGYNAHVDADSDGICDTCESAYTPD